MNSKIMKKKKRKKEMPYFYVFVYKGFSCFKRFLLFVFNNYGCLLRSVGTSRLNQITESFIFKKSTTVETGLSISRF